MAESNRYKMSRETLEKLKEELVVMETVKAKEIAELIKEARSFGDLTENSEYDEAKTEQGKLYSRIAEYKDLIENAEIVDDIADAQTAGVRIGSLVLVRDGSGAEEKYEIVGSQEADPRKGRISDDSPIGKALLGHVSGDSVSVHVPNGTAHFEIISVENN